jgi:hypothetical protein
MDRHEQEEVNGSMPQSRPGSCPALTGATGDGASAAAKPQRVSSAGRQNEIAAFNPWFRHLKGVSPCTDSALS